MKTLRALCPLFLLLSALTAAAQKTQTFQLDRETLSRIEITSVFSVSPPSGFAPVRVRIANNTDKDITVPLEAVSEGNNPYGREHTLRSSFSVSGAPKKTTEHELLIPLCPSSGDANRYSASDGLRITASTALGSQTASFPKGGQRGEPFAAYTQMLAAKSLDDINRAASGTSSSSYYGSDTFAALCDPLQLPHDWRGLMGLDALSISSVEWETLPAGAATAILQWVKLGGTLDLYRRENSPTPESLGLTLPPGTTPGEDGHPLGTGTIRFFKWNGGELVTDDGPTGDTIAYAITGGKFPGTTRRSEYATALSAPSEHFLLRLGTKDFAAGQVGLILLIFGILVGPVNLFVFARAGRRHRLFFTTPIISGAAALILLLVIFFQDGTGGTGHRNALVYLDSADHNAYIHQQQISRTGVLFGSAFTLDSPAHITQAVMPQSRWTRFNGSSSDDDFPYYSRYPSRTGFSEAQTYSHKEKDISGDWFQSRAEQAQILDTIQPTRGRLELKPGTTPPVIISSLPATLDALYYLDPAGKAWTAPGPLTTGAEVTLQPHTTVLLNNWLGKQRRAIPGARRPLPVPGHFYATTTDPAAGAVPTLTSIDWETTTILLYGPLQ